MSKATVPMINFFPDDMIGNAVIEFLGSSKKSIVPLDLIALELGILNYTRLEIILNTLVEEGLVENTVKRFVTEVGTAMGSARIGVSPGYTLSDKLV